MSKFFLLLFFINQKFDLLDGHEIDDSCWGCISRATKNSFLINKIAGKIKY